MATDKHGYSAPAGHHPGCLGDFAHDGPCKIAVCAECGFSSDGCGLDGCPGGRPGVFQEKARVEWIVMCKPPHWDLWYQHGTPRVMQESEALARQAAADARAEYPHYDWKIVRRSIIETWLDL